jgi:hypothetical protein
LIVAVEKLKFVVDVVVDDDYCYLTHFDNEIPF